MKRINLSYLVGFFFLILFLSACKKEAELPINRAELVKILADVHLAESAVQLLDQYTKDSLTQLYYKQIFQIHQVSGDQFYQAMEIVRSDPKLLFEIYDEVYKVLDANDKPVEN